MKFKKLDENAVLPKYAHEGDVGMDLTAIGVDYDVEHDMYIYHTGLANETDYNIGGFLFPRSSNCKKECYLTNSVGIDDSAIYRGEIQARYKNRTSLQSMINDETNRRVICYLINNSKKSSIHFGSFNLFGSSNKINEDIYKKINDEVTIEFIERAKNLEFAPYEVGDRVVQIVFGHYVDVCVTEVSELSDTVRGEKGFGSTGK